MIPLSYFSIIFPDYLPLPLFFSLMSALSRGLQPNIKLTDCTDAVQSPTAEVLQCWGLLQIAH